MKNEIKILDLKTISKFMSLILRHNPGVVNITLDKNGWADIREFVYKINGHYGTEKICLQTIKDIVNSDNKNRYEISVDGKKIRARQGHSIDVDLSLEPKTPPESLYHGTSKRVLGSILKDGILKRSRQYVHLSEDDNTAMQVGSRHGEATVLKVQAGKMFKDGIVFYKSTNNVWLTEKVDPKYLVVSNYDARTIGV